MKKKLILIAVAIPLFAIALFILFLGIASISAFRPDDVESLTAMSQLNIEKSALPKTLSLTSWNIGYAGLDAKSNFVLDGGVDGTPRSKKAVEDALFGILDYLELKNSDITLLQEVDYKAHRTYRINEAEAIINLFPDKESYFSTNFKAFFVPFPISDPIGNVHSGILTQSIAEAEEAERYQLPGQYSWPVHLFHLKRCIMVNRYNVENSSQDLYVINAHLSAYDDGTLRSQQLNFLKELMENLYAQNAWVIIGGDWNSLFPGVDFDLFTPYTTSEENLAWIQRIPEEWTPDGWQWAIDTSEPTCRTLEKSYVPGENYTCIIDGFLVSPNVEILDIKTDNLDFAFSDHNPVHLTVELMNSH